MIRTTALLLAIAATTPAAARAGLWDVPGFGLAAADEIHGGVYIATDYVYDDHGANTLPAGRRRLHVSGCGRTVFKNAADLVEVRVQPLANAIAFGVRFNTLVAPPRLPVAAIGIDDGSAPVAQLAVAVRRRALRARARVMCSRSAPASQRSPI
jgi:hypothetical protein